MDLQKEFQTFIECQQLFNRKEELVLAVSGGVDSVVLAHLCHTTDYKFSIAHCNFKMRGEESDRDENFVKDLAKKYNVPFEIKAFETKAYAEEKRLSIQEAARDLRYAWFNELGKKILTAHHGDDNIETVLINFFRGTGIRGLKGMDAKHGNIIRPLLFASREQIETYATSNNLEFVQDSSNLEDEYTRNYLRIHVLPALEKVFPRVKQNLADNTVRFSNVVKIYDEAIAHQRKKLLESFGAEYRIAVLKLQKQPGAPTLLYELLKDFGFSPRQIGDLLNLLEAETGRYVDSPTHRVLRNRRWLVITPLNSTESQTLMIENDDEQVLARNFSLHFKKIREAVKLNGTASTSDIAMLDANCIRYPLMLRKWRQGDYFYPLGMRKKKKLARFFIDQKLSRNEKENVWVLESDKRIIWVVGQRIDDRFKLTPATKSVLQIKLTK